jgi:alkaline phosphatase
MPDLTPILDLAAYGLIGAALLALLERLVPVVPSYGLFIFLGSSMVQSPIDLLVLIVVTTLASTLGGVCWYGIGFALGEERTHNLVRRFGRYVWLREAVYLSLARRYSRNAFVATFVGQTIPVVRVYLSLPAGILVLPLATFTLAVLVGSSLWVGGFILLGYGLHVLGWNPLVTTIGAVGVLLIVEGGILWLVRRRQRASAEFQTPSP